MPVSSVVSAAKSSVGESLLQPGGSLVVLGVESSCDETGVGIVRVTASAQGEDPQVEVLADVVASSMEQHARFGGVVPEIASRAHLESIVPVMREALQVAGIERPDVVAATVGPGLSGALLVGASAAKAYAAGWGVPFYGVNHLRELGSTLDDAAGEAYDKVARLLGLGYPGGPVIDKHAARGDRKAIDFPRGLSKKSDPAYDFSFSGLKTAVARYVESAQREGREINVDDVCASFQEAVCDVLTKKAVRACVDTGARVLLLSGGVAANPRLRQLAEDRCGSAGIELRVPRLKLCTDNGVMIAALASQLIAAGVQPSDLSVGVDPSLGVEIPSV